MSLFAISDVHLGYKYSKTMDRFGKNWVNHDLKIKEIWEKMITHDDSVIMAGDFSWAMNLEDAAPDLDFIDRLPGKKIFVKGNHDYWWDSLKKCEEAYPRIKFIQNNYAEYEDYAICGTRGWLCPNDTYFKDDDEKIYIREVNRLSNSLFSAKAAGYNKFICVLHYPPINDKGEGTGFTDLIQEYECQATLFGHLHGNTGYKTRIITACKKSEYSLISCDHLNFTPKLIM